MKVEKKCKILLEMLAMEINRDSQVASAPLEAKKNEFNPYQDNGGYVSFDPSIIFI